MGAFEWVGDLGYINRLSTFKFLIQQSSPFVHGSVYGRVRDSCQPHHLHPGHRAVGITRTPRILRIAEVVASFGVRGRNHHVRIRIEVLIVKSHQIGWSEICNRIVSHPSPILQLVHAPPQLRPGRVILPVSTGLSLGDVNIDGVGVIRRWGGDDFEVSYVASAIGYHVPFLTNLGRKIIWRRVGASDQPYIRGQGNQRKERKQKSRLLNSSFHSPRCTPMDDGLHIHVVLMFGALDFAWTDHAMCGQSFAHFAKGGNHEREHNRIRTLPFANV